MLVVLHAIKVGNAIVSAQIRPDHGPESLVHLSIQVIPSGLHVQQHFSQWIEIPDRENSLKTVSLSTEDLLSPAINRFQFAQMLRHQRVRVRLGASPFVLNEPLEVQIRSQTCDHRLMRLNADLELWLEMLQQHQLHQKVNQAPSWSRSEQLQESIANQIQQLVVHWNPNGWFESIVSLNQSNTTYQSVTLTASVIQTLARLRLDSFYVPKLHQVISINYEMIFKTVSWLLKQQQFHGQFPAQSLREVDTSNQSLHPKRVLTVTATVLSALNTVETLLNHFVNESNQFKMNEVRQQKASQISPSFDDIQSDPYDAFNRDVHSQLKSLKPAIQRAVHYLKSGLDIENRLVRYVHTGSIHELFTSMQEADEDLLVITLALSEQDRRCGHFLINALHERVRRQTDRGLYYGSRSLAPKRFRVQQHRIARLPSLVEPNESKLVTETALLLLARLALNEYSDNRRFVHFLITRKAHFHRWSSLEATCLALRAIRLSNIADRQQISRDRTWSHPVYAKQNAIHDLSPSIVNATIRIELSGSVDPGFWIKRTLHWPDSVWNGFAFDTEWPEELNTLSISALGPASYALDVHYDLYLADLAQSTLPFVYSFDLHVSISSTKPEALPKESGSRTSDDFMLVPKADLSLRACYRWTLLKQSSNSPFATLIIQLPTGVRPLRLGHISSENDRDTSIVEHFKSINSLMLHLQKVNHDQACFLVDLRVDFPAWNASTDLLAQIYDRHQPELRTIARIQMNYISNLANSPNSINPTSIDRSLGFCSNDLSGVGTRNSAHFITAAINLITLLLIIMLLIVLFRNIYFILFKLRPKKRP